MATLEEIKQLTTNKDHIAFAEFILANMHELDFPDYQKLDLMQVPHLVRNIWAVDFRNIESNDVSMHFSGTAIDAHYERNITGKSLRSFYPEEDYKRNISFYYDAISHKKKVYSKRIIHFSDDYINKQKVVESLFFPCSNNQTDINFGIGYTYYSFLDHTIKDQLVKF
ncbi:MAG: hypothetical protein HON65_04345 [Rhodospirillales bacterium]|nr:hypothetical protein [Rhodospirillales bacterium]